MIRSGRRGGSAVHPEVEGHRMALRVRMAEVDAARDLAVVRRGLVGPPPPRSSDAVWFPPAPAPAPAPVVWVVQAPAPSAPVWRPRRSVLGWLRLMWVASWAFLITYGMVLAALMEIFG